MKKKTAKKVKAIPDGYPVLTPYFMVPGAAKAIEFYTKAFGAKERLRIDAPGGMIGHSELTFGESLLMLADEFPGMGMSSPATLKGTTASFMIYVKDVDKAYQRALAAGATSVHPPKDKFYGDRSCTISDPWGHLWSLATHIEDMSVKEMKRRAGIEAAKMQPPPQA